MDRNALASLFCVGFSSSLSVRRAWIEISIVFPKKDRQIVALRKESVDRNRACTTTITICTAVALRKESVDRNAEDWLNAGSLPRSLSVRRAWIEICYINIHGHFLQVALRKESVDRNGIVAHRLGFLMVALRKESVDRNLSRTLI